MATYGRDGILAGTTFTIRVVSTDTEGNIVDMDANPIVYIYDVNIDDDTIQAEMDAATFTSKTAGPISTTRISTGYYEMSYNIPSGASAGSWKDVWIATLNGTDSNSFYSFNVTVGGKLLDQRLNNNELIIIDLDPSIASLDGTKTLGFSTQVSFTTTYKPLYASPELVRLEVGPWIDFIPDNTLALMIYWSSQEADFIVGKTIANSTRIGFARTKFVVYDSALRAAYIPSSSFKNGSWPGNSKQLGDLKITAGRNSSVPYLTSGLDTETVGRLKKLRDEWSRVVNAGGNIVPGQGFAPSVAIRAKFDPDRRKSGRLWLDPMDYYYAEPTANVKTRIHGGQRNRYYFWPTPVDNMGVSRDTVVVSDPQ